MPIYGKDPPISPPELEIDGTSTLDSRYHVTFSDSPDASTEVERLGLMLSDSGGRLAFNVQHSSPFGGMLGGGGSPTDKDLSRYTVRSQSDWRAGRGLLTSYEDTLRFHDGVADTRFPGKVMLPPALVPIPVTTSDAPQNVAAAGAVGATGMVYARWDAAGGTPAPLTAHTTHVQVVGTDPQNDPLSTTGDSTIYVNDTGFRAGYKFTPQTDITLSTLTFYASRQNYTAVNFRVYLRADGGSQPTGNILRVASPSATLPTNGTRIKIVGTFDSPYSLVAFTTYWFEFTSFDEDYSLHLTSDQFAYGSIYEFNNYVWTGERAYSDLRFVINNGTTASDGPETRLKVATPFTVGASDVALGSIDLRLSTSKWGTLPTATVKVFSDNAGSPGTEKSTGTLSSPDAVSAWKSVGMSAFTLSAGTTYWIVLEITSTAGVNDTSVEWSGVESVTQIAKTNAYASGAYAGWVASSSRLYYKINGTTTTAAPYFTPYTSSVRTLAQSFTAPPIALAITKVQIYARRVSWDGSATLTFALYTGAVEPTTLVATGSALSASSFADVLTTPGWVTLPITFTTIGGTKYWIVLTPTAPGEADRVEIDWYRDTTDTYADGGLAYQTETNFVSGAWTTSANDRYFKVNNGTGGATAVTVAPLRFEGKWYVAAGVEVLRFNTSTNKFDQVASLSQVVTSLASFNGNIYAAQGDATQIQMSPTGDSGSWSAVPGGGATHVATHLRAYNGYLYTLKAFGGEGAIDYTNGTDWNSGSLGAGSQLITVATSDVALTGIVGLQNEIFILASTGIYTLSSSFVYQVIDYSNEQFQDNGKNALTWMSDGRMYVPVAQSLHAYDGSRLVPVGLDLDDGLPVGEQGHVSALVGSRNFMFAAVDAGASGRSGVYAFNGVGWHCLAKASVSGARIRAIGLEQITSASARPRLWYWEDGTPWYMEFPDLTDLPAGYASSRFAQGGYVESVWLGGELSQIPKDFTSIIVRSTGIDPSTGTQISVRVEVDRSGIWFQAGNIIRSPHQELELLSASFVPTTTAAGSTTTVIQTVEEGALRIDVGEFIRIGTEVSQVASRDGKEQFTIVTPLETAPAAGVTIYPARPSGREIRYRLDLETSDQSKTPVVNRVSLKWGELILDKRRITMTVRIEDGMRLRGSNAQTYPYSAASLRAKLREWMRRTSPFYLTDPTGDQLQVKIVAGNETSFAESNTTIGTMWGSRLSLTLDEV